MPDRRRLTTLSKGRVERAIRYLRTSFFPLRQTWSLETLNEAVLDWNRDVAAQRRWPQDRRRSVEQAYREEQAHLRPLPGEPFPTHEQVVAKLRRSPYVRFDANRYTVPHDRVHRAVTVLADLDRVRVFDRAELIAEHPRCWGKQQVIEDPAHLDALWRKKRHAREHRGQHRLTHAVPQCIPLLAELARRQRHLATAVERLVFLLDAYGAEEMARAVDEALQNGSPYPETVRLILDRRSHERQAKPPLPIALPDDPKLRNLVVRPHPLNAYDPDPDDDSEEEPS